MMVVILATTACNNKRHMSSDKDIVETDRFYSALSSEKGMNTAFLAMFDSAGVLLRANHPPIEGIEAIKTVLTSQEDSTFTLTWEPSFARISVSGDMGYTYGTYTVTEKATDSVTGSGTYATVWQKQEDGSWKAVLDTGNPGLGK
jgi:ketosteroid isomerase-like protein